jgi:hypothetical protein
MITIQLAWPFAITPQDIPVWFIRWLETYSALSNKLNIYSKAEINLTSWDTATYTPIIKLRFI